MAALIASLIRYAAAGQRPWSRMTGTFVPKTKVPAKPGLAGTLTRLSLNRRRLAGWDTDWQATGPRWTTRA